MSIARASDPSMAADSGLTEPLEDPVYRSIVAVRETEWRILSTHYKPFHRARLVCKIPRRECDARARRFAYAQIYPTLEKAQQRHRSALAKAGRASRDDSPALHEGWKAVLWTLPYAPRLRTARVCMRKESFRRFLDEHALVSPRAAGKPELPQLVRYVPRKRALFRTRSGSTETLYIKVYGSGSKMHAASAANLARLARARLPFRTPRLLAHDERRRIVVMDEVPGISLARALEDAQPADFALVGAALARLHTSSVATIAEWSPSFELTALDTAMADVERALPPLSPRIRKLVERLERRANKLRFEERGPIHGNLFCDQILSDEGAVGIVDWDDLRYGDPLFDVARLAADVVFRTLLDPAATDPVRRALETLIHGYRSERNAPLDGERFQWHLALALLMRAKISALRTLPSAWVARLEAAIEEADNVFEGRRAWGLRP